MKTGIFVSHSLVRSPGNRFDKIRERFLTNTFLFLRLFVRLSRIDCTIVKKLLSSLQRTTVVNKTVLVCV